MSNVYVKDAGHYEYLREQGQTDTPISKLNDRFRKEMLDLIKVVPGGVFLSEGMAHVRDDDYRQYIRVVHAVMTFDDWNYGNDPWLEKDMAKVEIDGLEPFFFKIEYFEDEEMEWGCEDPADVSKCYRKMTILFCSEY